MFFFFTVLWIGDAAFIVIYLFLYSEERQCFPSKPVICRQPIETTDL